MPVILVSFYRAREGNSRRGEKDSFPLLPSTRARAFSEFLHSPYKKRRLLRRLVIYNYKSHEINYHMLSSLGIEDSYQLEGKEYIHCYE